MDYFYVYSVWFVQGILQTGELRISLYEKYFYIHGEVATGEFELTGKTFFFSRLVSCVVVESEYMRDLFYTW